MKASPDQRLLETAKWRGPPGKGRPEASSKGTRRNTARGRGTSIQDLDVPVEDLLTAEQEIWYADRVQTNLQRIQEHIFETVTGYEEMLQHMEAFVIGRTVVVAWYPFRDRMEKDLARAAELLVKARKAFRQGTTRGRREARRHLDRGASILSRYPLTPEMLFSWAAAVAASPTREDDISSLVCSQKSRRIVTRAYEKVVGARDRLVLPNLRLILKETFRFQPSGMRRADLFQEGILGLHRAVFRYDPSRKTRFSTYATYWIRQAIRKSLIDRARLIRVPQAVQEGLRKTEKPLDPIEERRVRRILAPALSVSGEDEDDPRDRLEYEMLRASDRETTAHEENFHVAVVPDEVRKALGGLTGREREVLKRRFGIGGDRSQTLEEIGSALKLSRERIRQIERKAISKMKTDSALQSVYEDLS